MAESYVEGEGYASLLELHERTVERIKAGIDVAKWTPTRPAESIAPVLAPSPRARRGGVDVRKPPWVAALQIQRRAGGKRLCRSVASGVPLAQACRIEGVGRTTLHDWRAQGAAGVQPYAAFVVEFERALGRVVAKQAKRVVAAARYDWRAAAWWLERHNPELYAPRQTIRHEKAPADMTDEEFDEAIARFGYVRVSDLERGFADASPRTVATLEPKARG